jgi:hypothetical protein
MTDVIFYIGKDNEPLAYFPNEIADTEGNKVCYSHIGQHSACSQAYVKTLKKATPDEYKDLKSELIRQGYTNLNILNISLKESILKENVGYGQQSFYFAKNGDSNNYLFKVDTVGIVISIGKFSKFTQPTEQKSEYAVISITKLNDEELDQAVIDNGMFTSNSKNINFDDSIIRKILKHLAIIIEDYLQKNPKVSKFYDEMQSNLVVADYDNKFSVSLNNWPGGNEIWKLQTIEKGKMNVISK